MADEKEYITEERKTYGLKAISSTMMPFAKKILGKKGFTEIDIIINWENIVGEEMAKFSAPQKISFQKDKKNEATLFVEVPTGAFALEIKHKEKYIIDKINTYFGYKAIAYIKIIQNNESMKKFEKKLDFPKEKKVLVTKEEEIYIEKATKELKNEKLKEILTKLGHSVFNKNSNFDSES